MTQEKADVEINLSPESDAQQDHGHHHHHDGERCGHDHSHDVHDHGDAMDLLNAMGAHQRVLELEAQLAQMKDDSLRALAEAQNIRRRSERDVENAHRFALEKFVNALLPIMDSLERGLSLIANDEAQKTSYEGMQLTFKMFEETLAKFNVETVFPEGEPFNPELHQAMSMQENKAMEPNSVLAVLQKGYTLHGRLVRPAMVIVSK